MNYQQMIHSHLNLWEAYVQHQFVQQLVSHTLPASVFKSYLLQNLTLVNKAFSLLVDLKKSNHDPVQRYMIEQYQEALSLEIEHHTSYFIQQGFTEHDLQRVPWVEGTKGYCHVLEEASHSLHIMDFFMVLSVHIIGYAEIGNRIDLSLIKPSHAYLSWIQVYTHSSYSCLLYTSPSPRDGTSSRMPSSA